MCHTMYSSQGKDICNIFLHQSQNEVVYALKNLKLKSLRYKGKKRFLQVGGEQI